MKSTIQRRKPFPWKLSSVFLPHPIRMPCLEPTTVWYRDVAKDYVKDVDGNVNVRLAYAYDTPPSRVDKGDRPFFLTSTTTLVTEKVDILHHAQASLEGKSLALKRDIQVSDGLRSYFAKITDLMHRNLLSWYEDDYVIAKDMVDNAAILENDQGRSGLCSCTCSPTFTSFMELNEYIFRAQHEDMKSSLLNNWRRTRQIWMILSRLCRIQRMTAQQAARILFSLIACSQVSMA